VQLLNAEHYPQITQRGIGPQQMNRWNKDLRSLRSWRTEVLAPGEGPAEPGDQTQNASEPRSVRQMDAG